MQLVYEKNHISRPTCLPEHRLDPVFKISPVFRARHHSGQIQGHQALSPEIFRHRALSKLPGKPFRHRRLPHPRFSNERRVVFGSSGKNLHHPANFPVSADDRVDLPPGSRLSQIPTVLVQGFRFRFPLHRTGHTAGAGFVLPAVKYADNVCVQLVQVHAQIRQCLRPGRVCFPENSHQNVLRAYKAMPQSFRVLRCQAHHPPRPGRQSLRRYTGIAFSRVLLHRRQNFFRDQAVVPENFRSQTLLLRCDTDE